MTEEGWFIMYGGEDPTNNIQYDDTWVFYENKWISLDIFDDKKNNNNKNDFINFNDIDSITNGNNGNNNNNNGMNKNNSKTKNKIDNEIIHYGPGKRKGLDLLLLPISGLIILWGGERPLLGRKGGRSRSRSRNRILYEDTESNLENDVGNDETYEDNANNNDKKSGSIRNSNLQCLSDTYIFNATDYLLEKTQASFPIPPSSLPPATTPSTTIPIKTPLMKNAKSNLLKGWKRISDFPGDIY